ncbi:hypothetical protein FHY55_04060 [Oceanicola sp. D3]|uniref:TFIIB-type zinc ribbon-containing protein n=1 Tax=Oceanicola sp. D3 TaxID=2587163 RepID=UPI00111EEAE6|nr:zf-TFIIB domain-containing protein [Oceanicola sp. D3]QDC08469.1 hypothetical protein FHY55_04060 [Oceanicola sp. D3]
MNCPHCNIPLSMADRTGIEIDFCPQCRGIWLDRGELDKIIERASQPLGPNRPTRYDEGAVRSGDDGYRRYGKSYKSGEKYYGKKRKGGVRRVLDEIFDF